MRELLEAQEVLPPELDSEESDCESDTMPHGWSDSSDSEDDHSNGEPDTHRRHGSTSSKGGHPV